MNPIEQAIEALELSLQQCNSEMPMSRVALRGQLSSAIATIRQHQADGWRPIETAPRDGTRIDLWIPSDGLWDAHRACDCYAEDGCWFSELGHVMDISPAFWRSRPAAPGKEGL